MCLTVDITTLKGYIKSIPLKPNFVFKAKKNLQFKPIKWKNRLPKNVISDSTVGLTVFNPGKHYPENLRIVRFWDER